MATFLLTAKNNMFLNQGNIITKGSVFEVNVNRFGINESNLFLNPESRSSIMRQLANRDVDLVANRKEYFLNRGYFQVEQRHNVLENGRF
jgi:ribosomal protein S8E